MADPTNPTNPTNPVNPGGPGSQPPIDPGVANVFERMTTMLADANVRLEGSEKLLKAMAEHAGAVAEEAGKASVKLKDMFKVSDAIEENYKKIVDYGKKRSQQSIKEFQDAHKARKELETIVGLYEDALKNAKEHTKESSAMSSNLASIRKLMKALPKDGELTKDQLQGVADAFERASRNAKDLVKAMYDLSRTGATLKGIAGIFGATGAGKDFNSAVERKLEQIEEVKTAVKEAREIRRAATQKHMITKRGKAIEEMKGMAQKGGLTTDPDTGEVTGFFDEMGDLTKGGRHVLAKKMGFKPGTGKFSDFVAGEEMGGPEATGKAAAGWMGAMSEGGGAMEKLATVFEDGIGSLMEFAPEIIIPLELLAEAIKTLTGLFDTYVKQNKEMEAQIGKGGLFTQPGQGAGAAFAAARDALRPEVGIGTLLGMTFERNLAIAGAMANEGMAAFPSMTQGGNAANMGPGAIGSREFMRGGVGEVQRIVMGAGRVGGLTDQEGVEQVIKLLSEYRETIASSEDFMAQLNKDTAAAGISTTKYLKIIDEVSSSFDKMGKSLEQVTGVMRELSRYGSISSESLKDMMDFLEAGQQKTNMSNVQTAAFTQAVMDPKTLESLRQTEKGTLQNYVDALNAEGGKHGIQALDISSAIKSGDYNRAQGLANSMRTSINNLTDPVVKQNMTDSLNKIQDQINRVSGVMSPDFLKRAAAQGLYKEDPAQTIAALFTNLKYAAAQSGTTMKNLMAGGGNAEQQVMVQQLSEMLGVKAGGYANAFEMMRAEAQNRVQDVVSASTETDRKRNAKSLFMELYRGAKMKNGIPIFLSDAGLAKKMGKTADETFDNIYDQGKGVDELVKLFGVNLDTIAGDSETQDKILKANTSGNKQGADALADQLGQAQGIATRTQSIDELLSNTFKPLLIKLIGAVEAIATTVSKWFGKSGGDANEVQKAEAAQEQEMANVGTAIDDLNTNLDARQAELRKFQKEHTSATGQMSQADKAQAQSMASQIAIGADTLSKLSEIQQRGAFTTGAQESLVMDALGKITKSGAIPKLEGAGFKALTINNYYSSSTTQDNSAPTTVGTSPTESAEAVKQSPAKTPVGMSSLDNR